MKLAPYDELDVIREKLVGIGNASITAKQKREQCDGLLLDLFLLAYIYGVDDINESLNLATQVEVDGRLMEDSVYRVIDGMTYSDRISRWVDENGNVDVDAILRIAETEVTHNYNRGAFDSAKEVSGNAKRYGASGLTKTWQTMRDDKVRDTHDALEGVTVPMEERFATPDGDSAMHPGDFAEPENNINCRCYLVYKTN